MSTQASRLSFSVVVEDHAVLRTLLVGLMAFLTVVDLFAAQALLPTLVEHYDVSPAAMGLAVNACTFGMAAAGLAVALFGRRIGRRSGVVISLALLAIPTALLAHAPNLAVFAALRVTQGLFMATAFGLTLAYLGESFSAKNHSSAFAAYITGNVASNLFGRLIAASVADHIGLGAAFYAFAVLNIIGAALAALFISRAPDVVRSSDAATSQPASWLAHLRNPDLRAGFMIGFCILFAFIGTFTFVNFLLVAPPHDIGMMQLGFVYFVFLPSIFTTPLAGAIERRIGAKRALIVGFAVASLGLPMLLDDSLTLILTGMVLIAAGTFFAQAVATGFVSRSAQTDRAAASGIYLASYFIGGLVGTAVLGLIFEHVGWSATVYGVGTTIAIAMLLSLKLGAHQGAEHARSDTPKL
jgi:YNFM family putative membrane transporter